LPHTKGQIFYVRLDPYEGQTFYVRFAPRHYEKIGVMKSKRIKIKLVGNSDITPEVEQTTWRETFDYIFKKSISEKQSPAVDRGSQKLKGQNPHPT